jgi:hypothetical protein
LLCGDRLLFDFHSFPLRIVEVPERPQEGVLKMGFFDSIYGRSAGGVAPSGWRCEHLPYLVELDNWGVSNRPGQAHVGGCWVWGYDEISWFAHQDAAYRNQWLRYAWNWVREHDRNGFFQMPGSRMLHAPVGNQHWYYANTRSDAVPQGFSQEETIKTIPASTACRPRLISRSQFPTACSSRKTSEPPQPSRSGGKWRPRKQPVAGYQRHERGKQ